MVTVTDNVYTGPSGQPINVGWAGPPPSWASLLVSDRFVEIPNTNFVTFANANLLGPAYLGTDPMGAIVNAFCDPARKGNEIRIYGGGHGDGTCNAVIGFDLFSLQYTVIGIPTPPSKYPPTYTTYPSGKDPKGWFLPLSELTDPADQAYATTLARVSTHMYGAAVQRGNVTHYLYRAYGEFDDATGLWSGHDVDLGAQIYAINPQFNNSFLDQGTWAVHDPVTDLIFAIFVPGDGGGGYRSGVVAFNPVTRSIENIYSTGPGTFGAIQESSAMQVIGREIYIFTKSSTGYDQPQVMNQGVMFNMDARTFKKFVITGANDHATYSPSIENGLETIPTWYDGAHIHRWNYQPADRQYVMSLDPTPASGDGSKDDPFVLTQTQRTLAGTPPNCLFVYKRLFYIPEADCIAVLPRANSNWWALKL